MTAILDIVTFDNIRAVMGVNAKDIRDTHMADMDMELSLQVKLAEFEIDYETVVSEGTSNSPTSEQLNKYAALKTYSKYFCANQMVGTTGVLLLQQLSDGNVSARRFSGNTIEELKDEINKKFHEAENSLRDVFSLSASSRLSMVAKATPTYDPVTGA